MPEDNLYPEPDQQEESAPSETNENPKEEQAEPETALLPKSIFVRDVKPGDKCEFEVVGVHDGEIEIKYAKEGKSESRQPEMDDAMNKAWMSNKGESQD